MSRRLGWTGWFAFLALAACANGITTPTAQSPTGVLVGQVTRGPAGPVEGLPGQAGPPPASGVAVIVTGPGRAAATATTDSLGEYRMTLPAATYQVTVGALRPGEFVKGLPATVTIHPGTEARLDILIDTGIR